MVTLKELKDIIDKDKDDPTRVRAELIKHGFTFREDYFIDDSKLTDLLVVGNVIHTAVQSDIIICDTHVPGLYIVNGGGIQPPIYFATTKKAETVFNEIKSAYKNLEKVVQKYSKG